MPQISVQNLSKNFLVPHQRRTTLKENFIDFWRPKTYEKFAALTDVSFAVEPGEFLGIVGQNGCGKSTLLKILAGIYRPDSGTVEVNGRIAPLLELGIGFQQELSARENIFINGTLMGLHPRHIRELLPKIVEFAEIGHFLDLKVKNFSSGMRQRLAFAIAAHLDADIYLCDEVLAVGDENFQQKCLATFAQWSAEGKTIILVSHNASQIENICTRAIYLDKGQLRAEGDPAAVLALYHDNSTGAVI
jgi:ABC-type polysaccharide/polyol phosphate transport system ATPase subunit